MGSVYSAKKTGPKPPPKPWDVHPWPPNPRPPTPVLSVLLMAPATVGMAAATIEAICRAGVADTAALDGRGLRLSAIMEGVAVGLKASGDGAFGAFLLVTAAAYGSAGRHGFTREMVFDVDAADNGKTLDLTVEVIGATVTAGTAEAEVWIPDLELTADAVTTIDWSAGAEAHVTKDGVETAGLDGQFVRLSAVMDGAVLNLRTDPAQPFTAYVDVPVANYVGVKHGWLGTLYFQVDADDGGKTITLTAAVVGVSDTTTLTVLNLNAAWEEDLDCAAFGMAAGACVLDWCAHGGLVYLVAKKSDGALWLVRRNSAANYSWLAQIEAAASDTYSRRIVSFGGALFVSRVSGTPSMQLCVWADPLLVQQSDVTAVGYWRGAQFAVVGGVLKCYGYSGGGVVVEAVYNGVGTWSAALQAGLPYLMSTYARALFDGVQWVQLTAPNTGYLTAGPTYTAKNLNNFGAGVFVRGTRLQEVVLSSYVYGLASVAGSWALDYTVAAPWTLLGTGNYAVVVGSRLYMCSQRSTGGIVRYQVAIWDGSTITPCGELRSSEGTYSMFTDNVRAFRFDSTARKIYRGPV